MGALLYLLVGHARVAGGPPRWVSLEPELVQTWRGGLRYHHGTEACLGLLRFDLDVEGMYWFRVSLSCWRGEKRESSSFAGKRI